jgi:hypothetical protein
MRDSETTLCAYLELARLSHEKRQQPARDKFLVLAAAAACRAGFLEIAGRCRQLILTHNPAHQLGHFESVPAALRSPEFQTLLRRIERFCPYERAEHLLQELGREPAADGPEAVERLAGWLPE